MEQLAAGRQAFVHWLRTGRILVVRSTIDVEQKHNPWHDWLTGRFTSAGSGRYVGGWTGGGFTGGGGGRSGGGGATGHGYWPDEKAKRREPRPASTKTGGRGVPAGQATRSTTQPQPTGPAGRDAPPPVRIPSAPPRTTSPPPVRHIVRNGYEYQIDSRQRTRRVSGTLRLSTAVLRSRSAQARAGGADRRRSDDGGHYIAARFDGPKDKFNHFAQDANFNRGGYRKLEGEWAAEIKKGRMVSVTITPSYDGVSERPSVIEVRFSIDGQTRKRSFPNERQERPRGKP